MNILPLARRQFSDQSGNPYVGANLYIYQAGTYNRVSVFADSAGLRSIPSSSYPIVLDSEGKANVWIPVNNFYRIRVYNASETLVLYEEDFVGPDYTKPLTDATAPAPAPSGGAAVLTLNNVTGSPVARLRPVRWSSATAFELAAGTFADKAMVGFTQEPIAAGSDGLVQVDGVIHGSFGEWQLITSEIGGLVPDSQYYLSFTTSGTLVRTIDVGLAPPGSYLVSAGYALTPNDLKIEIEPPIRL
jgi:hypothetical protein